MRCLIPPNFLQSFVTTTPPTIIFVTNRVGFIIVLVGLYDDIKGINPKGKLIGQILAAMALMAYGFIIEQFTNPFGAEGLALGWLSVPVTLFWIVGITNAFNLLDNMDGLCAGTGMIAALATAYLYFNQLPGISIVALILAAALGAFLTSLLYMQAHIRRISAEDQDRVLILGRV